MSGPLAVIHNVSSVQRLVDMAKIVISMNMDSLVATKVYGAAAQSGIAEAYRMLLKAGKGLVVLPDLRDAVEVFRPSQVLLLDKDHANELIDPLDITLDQQVMFVFNGSDTPFSPQELSLGKPVYIRGLTSRAGSTVEASILLYGVARKLEIKP